MTYIVSGYTSSRLSELTKFKPTNVFLDKYIQNGSYLNNGVDYSVSTEDNVIYYIDEIKYNDIVYEFETITTFNFYSSGTTSPDFIHVNYIKNPNKQNLVNNVKLKDDVFIERSEISAFENNYKLEFIRNMVDLNTYASGMYFNIIDNK